MQVLHKLKENKNSEVFFMFGLVPYSRRNREVSHGDEFFPMNRIFDNFFNDSFLSEFAKSDYSIRADIKETDKEFLIDAELPGVDKNNIQLQLKDDVLTIGVEQKQENEENNQNYIRKERRYGCFRRSFYVENVNSEGIKASYENGILHISLPKMENERKRDYTIPIN